MDVDKERIALLNRTDTEVAEESVIRNEVSAIRKVFAKLKDYGEVIPCYEAGSFGFGLSRHRPCLGLLRFFSFPIPILLIIRRFYRFSFSCQLL
jgi:hypothetical protein